ncbi:MAG: 2-dehydropantoate 2-reductase [Proteobacteria bacterium]|nr:2-dehydropantoate 2-reductase [Pseudomonadota bacterium]
MKICVYGAGAIGGFLGVRLSQAGAEVSLVARGAHLAAMREDGVKLITGTREEIVFLPATDDAAELGPQDYVIVTLKAHQLAAAAAAMRPLLGPDTAIVTAADGIPYWYFHGHGGKWEGRRLASIDPDGRPWDLLGPQRAVGCVVHPTAEMVAPGAIRHVSGDWCPLGEPSGETTPRIKRLATLLETAELKAPILSNIRDEIWLKLWDRLGPNPIDAQPCATLGMIIGDTEWHSAAPALMTEAAAIGDRFGVAFRVDAGRRTDGAAGVGAPKTSMPQDVERGRALEIDALVSVVQELGRVAGIATPTIDIVQALVRQRARSLGLDPQAVPAAPAVEAVAAD